MGASGVPGFGGFGAGDMAFSGSSPRDVDSDSTGGSRGGPNSKGKDEEPKTKDLERIEVKPDKEFINPKYYYDTRRVPISSMTKDLIDWLLKNDPDAISDDGITVRVRTGDKKIESTLNGSVKAKLPDNLPQPQRPQRLARYEIQRSDFGVDTRIDRGEPLSSYGDVLAAKRIEVQRQQDQQQAQPRTRLEYLQSRWGHMTNAEAKEFVG